MRSKVSKRLVRVQVLMTEAERETLRREAERQGQSLSGWLRERGVETLEAGREDKKISSAADLKRFFAECRRREKEREPDWREHQRVIDASRGRGKTET
jgi:hypothetical protein